MAAHLLAFILALVSPAAPSSRPSQAPDAEAILARAALRHRSLSTLQVDFTQRIRNPVLETDETSAGVFYYRAPLSYRIAFSKPSGDVIVSTGREVWIYLPSSQPGQVIESAVTAATRGLAPYQFISDLQGRYEPALVGEEPIGDRNCDHLTLTPAVDDAEYARVELWVEKQTAITRRMEVQDRQGITRLFSLSDPRVNSPLDASLFRFEPPAGVPVFEQ